MNNELVVKINEKLQAEIASAYPDVLPAGLKETTVFVGPGTTEKVAWLEVAAEDTGEISGLILAEDFRQFIGGWYKRAKAEQKTLLWRHHSIDVRADPLSEETRVVWRSRDKFELLPMEQK